MFLQARDALVAAALAAAMALTGASAAAASTLYRYDGGRLVARDDPALPPRALTEPPAGGAAHGPLAPTPSIH